MRRSKSYPQLLILAEEEESIEECSEHIQDTLDSLVLKETECEELRLELAHCETQYNGLVCRAEQMEMENQFLTKENASLNEESRVHSDRLEFLEQERNQQRLQVSELECFITELQKNFEDVENAKRTVSEELSRQRNGFLELQCSKTDLEDQVQQLQESTEWRRKEDDRVRELVQESDLLRAELQEMEQHLQDKDIEVRDVQQLRTENHEMELQISQMVQQNIQLRRQLNDVSQTKDNLEQQNQALVEGMQNLKMESSYTREFSPSHVHCIVQEEEEVEEEYVDDDGTYDDDDFDDNSGKEMKEVISVDNHPARTPPAISLSLAEEFQFALFTAHSPLFTAQSPVPVEDKEEQSMPNPHDALDEYVHLTVAAVKIRFHMVHISSEDLIKRAKKLPFYRQHDELTGYMQKQLKKQEAPPPKPEQDYRQQQEPACKKRDEDEQRSASTPHSTPSMFKKIGRLFRPQQSATELPK